MRVNKYLLPIVTLVALLGTVWVARAAGTWQTSGREMLDPNKPLTGADIKGWMPVEFVSESYGIAPETLLELLGLPANTPLATPLKELESIIEVSEVRTIIDEHRGENRGENRGEFAPAPEAAPTATPAATATPATTEHRPGQGGGEGTGAETTPLPAGAVLPAAEIKGRMTLREVSELCDVPLEALVAELGLPGSVSPDTLLREIQTQIADFDLPRVREVVAALQD